MTWHRALAIFLGVLTGWLIGEAARTYAEPRPCSAFANVPAQSVPARCLKNFEGDK